MTFFARTTPEETALIDKIAQRIMEDPELSPYVNKMTAMIEIILTHCNGTPLALDALLAADPVSFWHDIVGIRKARQCLHAAPRAALMPASKICRKQPFESKIEIQLFMIKQFLWNKVLASFFITNIFTDKRQKMHDPKNEFNSATTYTIESLSDVQSLKNIPLPAPGQTTHVRITKDAILEKLSQDFSAQPFAPVVKYLPYTLEDQVITLQPGQTLTPRNILPQLSNLDRSILSATILGALDRDFDNYPLDIQAPANPLSVLRDILRTEGSALEGPFANEFDVPLLSPDDRASFIRFLADASADGKVSKEETLDFMILTSRARGDAEPDPSITEAARHLLADKAIEATPDRARALASHVERATDVLTNMPTPEPQKFEFKPQDQPGIVP
ncbi:MAG: hypothetical protein WC807_08915 [Hyphomicrobium sp.]|nr:MAG: hypothetical protein B7Y80_15710 [Hyphomicrobium sp. 32-62-53]